MPNFKILSSIMFLILISAFSIFAQTPSQFFQQALLKENGEGDLKAAVEIYQRIVDDATADRSLKANALLHIGICWEKLGKQEAKITYKKVIDEYSDVMQIANEARNRLDALLISLNQNDLSIRKIWEEDILIIGNLGPPSIDGQYIPYIQPMGGLVLLKPDSKEKLPLLENWQMGTAWSPDGKSLAYSWQDTTKKWYLQAVGLDGIQHINIPLATSFDFDWAILHDWSPKGNYLLVKFQDDIHVFIIAVVSIEDGSIKILKSHNDQAVYDLRFSPDGNYIVYDLEFSKENNNRDIKIIDLANGIESTLVSHTANDYVIGWASGGEKLIFCSNRSGDYDLWFLTMENGASKGEPVLLVSNVGEIHSLGITKNDALYYALQVEKSDVYSAKIDLERHKVIGKPDKITEQFPGSNSVPSWSPDGKYLAYRSERNSSNNSTVLCIKSEITGETTEIKSQLQTFGSFCWHPQKYAVLAPGTDLSGKKGIFEIDIESGGITPIILFESPAAWALTARWSSDGKKIFYEGGSDRGDYTTFIYAFDVATGKQKELHSEPTAPMLPVPSPDNKNLALQLYDQKTEKKNLSILNLESGDIKKVLDLKKDNSVQSLIWSPDGQELIYSVLSTNGIGSLQSVSVDGGVPNKYGLMMKLLFGLSLHPNGERIAFSSAGIVGQIWVMENFLPETKNTK